VRGDVFWVDEPEGARWRVELELLAEGKSKLTPEQAAVEIDNAEAGVAEIRERSPEFAEIISGRPILYELIDDYGMGAVRLAFKDRSGFHSERRGLVASKRFSMPEGRWANNGTSEWAKSQRGHRDSSRGSRHGGSQLRLNE
jgi:hypothetical protein